jgi:RNA polymerase sigma-70 factor (ECF subfamily)
VPKPSELHPSSSSSSSSPARAVILDKLRERIVAFAASRMQRDVAEDLAQEVLLLLHEKYSQVEELDELLPLSMKIVRFKMMSYRRKLQRRGEITQVPVEEAALADDGLNPFEEAERTQMRERVTAAIAQLGDRCRRLFALKLDGKTFAEIQQNMGAGSINTVYTWDFRCRQELLERLGGTWERIE